MNTLTLLNARVAAEPELRRSERGGDYTRLLVAEDVGYGNRRKTNWWNLTVFGASDALTAANKLYKGARISLTAKEATLEAYTGNDGETRVSGSAVVVDFTLPERQATAASADAAQNYGESPKYAPPSPAMPTNTAPQSDDIPF